MNKLELISEVLVDELKKFERDIDSLKKCTKSLDKIQIKPDVSLLKNVYHSHLENLNIQYQHFHNQNQKSIEDLKKVKKENFIYYKVLIILLTVLAIISTTFNINNLNKLKVLENDVTELNRTRNIYQAFIIENDKRKEAYYKWIENSK